MVVISAGLDVIGAKDLGSDVYFAGFIWYSLACLAILDPRYLIPTIIIPLYLYIAFPDLRILMNYGLVKLGWLDYVYNPGFKLMTEIIRRGLSASL